MGTLNNEKMCSYPVNSTILYVTHPFTSHAFYVIHGLFHHDLPIFPQNLTLDFQIYQFCRNFICPVLISNIKETTLGFTYFSFTYNSW